MYNYVKYGSYQTWCAYLHLLAEEIKVKLKAVLKYESPIINDKKDFMKYGSSDK